MRGPLSTFILSLALAAPIAPAIADAYTFTSFDVPGVSTGPNIGTAAYGINNVGQVVGTYTTTGDGSAGFVLDTASGAFTTFTDPSTTGKISANGINDAGQIVGTAVVGSKGGFLRDPSSGSFTSFGFSPFVYFSSSTTPTSINDAGQISGYYVYGSPGATYYRAFMLDPTTSVYTFLSDPPGVTPTYTLANGINNVGQIVGYSTPIPGGGYPTLPREGFVFDVGTGLYTTLVDPDAGSGSTFAQGINDTGQVVGYDLPNNGSPIEGFVLDLASGAYTALIAPGASSTYAQAINNAGQIVGYYQDNVGVEHGFIATPQAAFVPEPASAALLGVSLLGLGMIRFRRLNAR